MMTDAEKKVTAESIGNRFARKGDPFSGFAAVVAAHYGNEPMHESVSEWLVMAFHNYIHDRVPFEQSLGFTAKRGKTSPARSEAIHQQIRSCMAEMGRLQIRLNKVDLYKAAEMVEARLYDACARGECSKAECYTYDVLIKYWYATDNHWRGNMKDQDVVQMISTHDQFSVDLTQYPAHTRPV